MKESSTGATSSSTTPTAGGAAPAESENPITNTVNFADHLPLQLIQSQVVSPSPNRSEAAIDWLPDFAGHSWIAYGASSLVVISHLPNPHSEAETIMGPIFRQTFELSTLGGCGSCAVSSVSWAPDRLIGELAAALDNCIILFSPHSDASCGSFCWSQTAVLNQATKVEAIKWTGAGDGIISAGDEVVFWRSKGRVWEVAWKFKPQLAQQLVSTTWSIEGPSATAPLIKDKNKITSSSINQASKYVLVFQTDGTPKYMKTELGHPLPVSMIQWRPSNGKRRKDSKCPLRQILLTCCVDGTVRLWCDIDDGKARKLVGDINDQKATRHSFHVAAVIEMNQTLNGTLGSDIFVRWATEIDGMTCTSDLTNGKLLSHDSEFEKVGRCEWLVGFGPQRYLTLWAVHCLDDIAPVRFPRVKLWKTLDITCSAVEAGSFLLDKVVILRKQVSGPPNICSFVWSLPCNSFNWVQFHTQSSSVVEDASSTKPLNENLFSCSVDRVLNIDSHTGKILQVALHPYGSEIKVAASLDADGMLLFWSFFAASNCIMDPPNLNPGWRLSDKLLARESYLKYTCMIWAHAIMDKDWILLAGHAKGVDFLIINISNYEDGKISCHELCTIPSIDSGQIEGPTNIYSIPLPCTCKETFVFDSFMLLAVWKEPFQALSWKITIHSCVSERCHECSFNTSNVYDSNRHVFEKTIEGKRYVVNVDPWSSVLPNPYVHDQVSSFAIVCPSNVIPTREHVCPSDKRNCGDYSYHMVIGCSDGNLRLWRCVPPKPSNSISHWELVGMLAAHQGPITAISVSTCGQKIATIGPAVQPKTSSTLLIWESVSLMGAGSFILEDTLFLNSEVVGLNWQTLGNGQLLLGLCLQHELQVHARSRCGVPDLLKPGTSLERNCWLCIACYPSINSICNFHWGPEASAVVVHKEYFCLVNQWLSMAVEQSQNLCHTCSCMDKSLDCNCGHDMLVSIFTDNDAVGFKASEVGKKKPPKKTNVKNGILSSLSAASIVQKYTKSGNVCLWSVSEVADNLCGLISACHPEALLMNLYSGKWKRAYLVLRRVVENVTSNNSSARGVECSLKFGHVISPVHLSHYFEGLISERSSDNTFQWNEDAASIVASSQLQQGLTLFGNSWVSDISNGTSMSLETRSGLSDFVETLEKSLKFAAVSNDEKLQMLAISDLLHEISDPNSTSAYRSLDDPGRRFWVALRFQQLYFVRKVGRSPSSGELVVHPGLIGWAFHSDCQENLFNSLLPGEPSWQDMQNIRVGYWYTNAAHLRVKMEKLARQQYLKNRDPKASALLYIALNRLQVLAGLFKISKDEKDKPLVGFLSRNFQEDKNKAAALKNAYVLLGKHQLELAVGFFLLGGDTSSAITVCAKNLGDVQLALVICRLIEGCGGPLERHLISNLLLPSAINTKEFWLASILEWGLGNYLQSFLSMLGVQMESLTTMSALSSNHASFLDPSIGQYCLLLATKNNMKNAIGEHKAAVLIRWAYLMSATALNRCGLPLEALDCLSSALGVFSNSDQGSVSDAAHTELGVLKPSPNASCNWISGDIASDIELHKKVNLAMQYISTLLTERSSWSESLGSWSCSEHDMHQDDFYFDDLQQKLVTGLAYFERKFSLTPLHLNNMVIKLLCENGLSFIGEGLMKKYSYRDPSQKGKEVGSFLSHINLPKLFLMGTEEILYLFSRFIITCCITCSQLTSPYTNSSVAGEIKSGGLAAWDAHMQGFLRSVWRLRAALKKFSGSYPEDYSRLLFVTLDLCEYFAYFVSAWLQRNHKVLMLIVKPLFLSHVVGHTHDINMADLKELYHQIAQLLAENSQICDVKNPVQTSMPTAREQGGDIMTNIAEDDKWNIISASLWGHMSAFLNQQLNLLPEKRDGRDSFYRLCRLPSFVSDFSCYSPDDVNMQTQIPLVSAFWCKILKITSSHISSYLAKKLTLFLHQKAQSGSSEPTLFWLDEFSQSQPVVHHIDSLNILDTESNMSAAEKLWLLCADSQLIHSIVGQDKYKCLMHIKQNHSGKWEDVYMSMNEEHQPKETHEHKVKDTFLDDHSYTNLQEKQIKKVVSLQAPKEIYKRNGELLEALCVNSIDQQEVALASNRKGIMFFNLEDGLSCREKSEYIWAGADWPQNGWAGSESTPVPTCVSLGVGLGSKKGSHLGLGGATTGVGSLAKPGRELTGGGAFGIPGYAGIGTSGLGWGVQEDFEEVGDPPATLENIHTRAFSSHPSRPLLLVGSSNTHVYLWEFGRRRATATYGVLPAANVPPPYALASISSVQFDHYGHRFATAALDGTVCTWQLEVGGRSNIHPLESSLCFSNHALDIAYITASGSIIAVAGYSSNGVNVVLWDTLAPPASSRASIMCHEGGARSLSVFDNDIGSGSISPLIVTGGKGGDVGLHDFRYIATGRTKRHRHSDRGDQNIKASSTADVQSKIGEQNADGMLWYIPKAHSGSVTKISIIPDTSFFLTGSKDGDVKLWDAKRAKLIFHWPRVHERHTFLQPSSRGFGEVVRAAVTDIQAISHGFLTCGGDGSVKLVQLNTILREYN